MLKKLDKREADIKKQKEKIEKDKAQMQAKAKKFYDKDFTLPDDGKPVRTQDRNERYLFKTIMCPLGN